MEYILIFFAILLAFGGGVLVGRNLIQKVWRAELEQAQEKAQLILDKAKTEGENFYKTQEIAANDYFQKLKAKAETELDRKRNLLITNEKKLKQQEARQSQLELKLKQRELNLNQKFEQLKRDKKDLKAQQSEAQEKLELTEKKLEEIEQLRRQQLQALENIAGLHPEEAKRKLLQELESETRSIAAAKAHQIVEEAKMRATKDARKIVLTTIQRTAAEHAIENCVSVFHLENDEAKGKIIGREGRNIRALEAATGIEIIVDDTPEAITLSGFDAVRREVARLSLQKLVADGRIHPARIEEVVAKTQAQMEEQILEIGERTVIELNIHGLHPELIQLVGRMRFRSSYGQNLLQHSREVANLCAIMAAEMGLPVKLAKRAGLLHDIGKVSTEDPEKPHALLGMEIAKRYNENPEVCNAIGAHHDEIEMTSLLSPIVQACDAISGSRPGARRETMQAYVERLHELENLALSQKGVNKCYAIQAGRELRVIVDAERVSDERAQELAFQISEKIERQMQYPGQVKVTVIREKRAISYAK